MKRSAVIATVALALSLLVPTLSQAAPKAGATCPKKGKVQVHKSYEFSCVKKKGKLVWSKGKPVPKEINKEAAPSPIATQTPSPSPSKSPTQLPAAPQPTPTPTTPPRDWNSLRSTDDGYIHDYNSWCDLEKDLPDVLNKIQQAYYDVSRCSGIYRIAQYQLGSKRPIAQVDTSTSLNVSQCQINEPATSRNLRGFMNLWDEGRRNFHLRNVVPGPKMNIQVIPIFSSDTAKPVGKPGDDYKAYLDFIELWAKYSSDGENNVRIRVPDMYLEFSKKVSDYALIHDNKYDNPNHVRFVNDLVAEVDAKIDFSGANGVLVLVPPGTPLANFQQAALKNFNTKEGRIDSGASMYPLTLSELLSIKYANFLVPFWWIHEMYHAGFGFDDHYGDGQRNLNTEYGMGWWSLMTPWGGDLSIWEKWIVGFITDSQVHCVQPTTATVRWIAPSSVKTTEKKIIVVPITQTKGIVIESIRAAGLYYKIPQKSEGVLVYVVDLEVQGHGLGMKLALPTNLSLANQSFFLSDATLQVGDSVTTNGFKITVVESGTYGDVVRVEKA